MNQEAQIKDGSCAGNESIKVDSVKKSIPFRGNSMRNTRGYPVKHFLIGDVKVSYDPDP
jgi:hypothetical protein